MIRLIRNIVLLLVLITWSIIGFLLWIPLLVRMIFYFSSIVTASAFTKIDISDAKKRLDFAIEFYPYGFHQIIESLKEQSQETDLPYSNDLPEIKPINWEKFLKKIIIDVIWTIIFWGIIFIIF